MINFPRKLHRIQPIRTLFFSKFRKSEFLYICFAFQNFKKKIIIFLCNVSKLIKWIIYHFENIWLNIHYSFAPGAIFWPFSSPSLCFFGPERKQKKNFFFGEEFELTQKKVGLKYLSGKLWKDLFFSTFFLQIFSNFELYKKYLPFW